MVKNKDRKEKNINELNLYLYYQQIIDNQLKK